MGIELYDIYKAPIGEWPSTGSLTTDLEEFMDLQNNYYTSTDLIVDNSYIPFEDIEAMVRSPLKKKITRVYLLYPDEKDKKEITSYVLNSGTLEKKNSSGQSKSISLTFANPVEYMENGQKRLRFLPIELWDDFDSNVKIRIVTEIYFNNRVYQIQEGIFVAFDPQMSTQNGAEQLTIQFYDKFAMLDGTIDGKGDLDYELATGTLIYDAVVQLLRLPKNSRGEPYDYKEIIFPKEYRKEKLAYTIKKTSDNSIGDLLLDIAKSIACDVQYNNYGNLEFFSSLDRSYLYDQSVAWNFNENEVTNASFDIKRSQIVNKVIVTGANINGFLCKGIAENKNPQSIYNINGVFGTRSVKINDNLISSNTFCQQRAEYELQKSMRGYITLSFQSIWIPHIEPNDIIRWSREEWGVESEEFLVNSISTPQDASGSISINATNIKEISR